MSNPYQAPADISADVATPGEPVINKVEIRAFARLREAKSLIGEQYLLFVGLSLMALLINGVAQGLLLGPLLCGLHLCFTDRLNATETSLNRLFKGFDDFLPSFVASLLIYLAFILTMGLLALATIVVIYVFANSANNANQDWNWLSFAFVPFTIMWIFVSMALYVPFVFVFPLLADRKLSAWEAIVLSCRGAAKNFPGIAWMFFLYALLALPCLMLCYIPFFFLVPLQFGAFFLLYQDVYRGTDLPQELG